MEIKIKEVFGSAVLFLIAVILLPLASCGPMVMTTGVSEPLPPWFYPNRLEVVRYVYFPEYHFYYDLSARTYLYLDGGVWVRRKVLPPRYRNLDLRRSRYAITYASTTKKIMQIEAEAIEQLREATRTVPGETIKGSF